MKKMLAFAVSVIMAVLALSGCGDEKVPVTGQEGALLPKGEVSYPLDTDVQLTYWQGLNNNVAQIANSLNETEFAALEYEKTGVKIKYIHPPLGQEKEQFNLMLSSGDLPDIISYGWYEFPGGAEKAISDGYISELNTLIADYAPNLTKITKQYSDIDKMIKTDTGKYYVFPALKISDKMTVAYGPIIRADWLNELELEIPETMDEWYVMLKAFKEKKGAVAPLSFSGRVPLKEAGAFVGAYGVKQNFYVEDGRVKYGPYEEGYREFIETFRKWYEEGLIDKNIVSIDGKGLDAKILNGETGATVGYNSSALGRWLQSVKDDKFDLTPAKYPVLKKGDVAHFAKKDLPYSISYSAGISEKSRNKELAARYMDYGYSDEGSIMYAFGREGESYTMVDGQPTYTDKILNNPEGLTVSLALAKYTHGSFEGPFLNNSSAAMQIISAPQQKLALELWAQNDAEKYLPPRMMQTADESTQINDSITEIETFVEEKTYQFIVGTEPLSNYDSFIKQLENLNVKRVLELKQAAYDRYRSR